MSDTPDSPAAPLGPTHGQHRSACASQNLHPLHTERGALNKHGPHHACALEAHGPGCHIDCG
eukprot:13846673-Alexandrium_andersonii.AAC.1